MVDQLPAPMLSPDVDLRDFAFMPLDVRRLLNSETWIEASEEPKFAHVLICLWCESWHQVPAASLPDNDIVLARLAMCDKSTWLAIKDKALSGFVKCSDGRYYHPTVVEKAKEAWERKQSQRARTRKATEARNEQRNDVRDDERNGVQGTVDRDSRQVKENTNAPAGAVDPTPKVEIPPGLNVTAWEQWVKYRKDLRKPLKPASIPAAQEALAAFGSEQIAVVTQSIANGWQGLFDLKAKPAPKSAPKLKEFPR